MVDRYTKAVLTVLAISLAALAVEQGIPAAHAEPIGCGATPNKPCYVANTWNNAMYVRPGLNG